MGFAKLALERPDIEIVLRVKMPDIGNMQTLYVSMGMSGLINAEVKVSRRDKSRK